jgi:hypothetical protein
MKINSLQLRAKEQRVVENEITRKLHSDLES